MTHSMSKIRCFGTGKPFYEIYHDKEWGRPLHDDQLLFEFLILEGAQAGLSWELILKKRDGYRKAFHNFDPTKVALMSDEELEAQMLNTDIIRNRRKIFATRTNAIAFLTIQKEFGSFDRYFWTFVDHQPINGAWKTIEEIPAETPLSKQISKDLKRRGMTFVGPTIIYSFMQATGLVNDHIESCLCRG
jgi:DNA-3-methyladenine glycosylase I